MMTEDNEKKIFPLANLKSLKQDMQLKKWVISCFDFHYKKVDYIVLVKLFLPHEIHNKYDLLKLDFVKAINIDDHLEVMANSNNLSVDGYTLREFFNIEKGDNQGNIFQQFKEYLGKFIPSQAPKCFSKLQKTAMVKSLSSSDSEDPKKVYCFAMRRNPLNKDKTPQKRSIFNDNKTRLLRPKLYEKLGADNTLSFCYSTDSDAEKTDNEILESIAGNI